MTQIKNLELPEAVLEIEYIFSNNSINLKTDKLIKNLHIYHQSKYVCFSDNYFDLLPGDFINVQVHEQELEELVAAMMF